MPIQNSDPSVLVNGVSVKIVGGSLKCNDGLGEQKVLTQSAGHGQVENVYSNDIETNIGRVSFQMRNTDENQILVRNWKLSGENNLVEVPAQTSDGLNRVYQKMAFVNDYELPYSPDGVIDVNFEGRKPTV